jgi:hypothetical protein
VPAIETAIDPRQPSRLEKKTNTALPGRAAAPAGLLAASLDPERRGELVERCALVL